MADNFKGSFNNGVSYLHIRLILILKLLEMHVEPWNLTVLLR